MDRFEDTALMKLFRNNTKMCINLSFVAVKVLLIFVIAIPRIGFFHTVTTNVIFGKFSTFSAFSKISKTAPTIFLKLSQHELDNAKNSSPGGLLNGQMKMFGMVQKKL